MVCGEDVKACFDGNAAEYCGNERGDEQATNECKGSIYNHLESKGCGRAKQPLVEAEEGELDWGFGKGEYQLGGEEGLEICLVGRQGNIVAVEAPIIMDVYCNADCIKGEGGNLGEVRSEFDRALQLE